MGLRKKKIEDGALSLLLFNVCYSILLNRAEEIEKFIKIQDKEMEEFVEEREKLIKGHEEKMAAMKRRHWEEEVELEKEFDAELTQLMGKYSPHPPTNTGNGDDIN